MFLILIGEKKQILFCQNCVGSQDLAPLRFKF